MILLFGHTACGAIKGAIDDVEMGNLTGCWPREAGDFHHHV